MAIRPRLWCHYCRAKNLSGVDETQANFVCQGKEAIVFKSQLSKEMQAGIQRTLDLDEERGLPVTLPDVPETFPAPKFTHALNNVEIAEGTDAHFTCRVEPSNDPKLKIEWLRNGQPIEGSKYILKFEFGITSMHINGPYSQDSGIITCRAKNLSGVDETQCNFVCQGKETIVRQSQLPKDMQAGIQSTLDMDAGRGLPVEHPEREVTYPAPHFTIGFDDVTITEGQDAYFACKVEPTDDPKLEVQWLRNGAPIEAGSKYILQFEFGIASMHIKWPFAQDSGVITCRAKNLSGVDETQANFVCQGKEAIVLKSQLSKEMQAGIQRTLDLDEERGLPVTLPDVPETFPAPKFTHPLSNVEIAEGSDAHFTCRVEPSNDPKLKIEWLRNGQPIEGSKYILKFEFGITSMHINGPYSQDSGIITCRAKNLSGVDETQCNFVCQGKETIVRQSQLPKDMQAGIQLTLDMDEGRGLPVEHPEREVTYPAPHFTIGFDDVTITEGQDAYFACKVEPTDDPKLGVQWLRNGAPIEAGSKYILQFEFGVASMHIKWPFAQDSGVITCRAKNLSGVDETQGNFVCQGELLLLLYVNLYEHELS
ncbi:kettin homolog [Amphiura filiformis]|uniref:kettin homolog n=1 Tax=Amphiura filiformis TaxID=82378 RepID=UPI003B21F3E5